MEAEDLLDKFAQDEGFGNWETVVLNCHHSVIRSVAIAAVNQALRQPHVMGSVCDGCGSKFDAMDISVNVMMTLDEIKENLCYNDLRNPYVTVDEETAKEIAENNTDCYCDNCFRGKTALAEELLKYYYMVNEK